MTHSKTRTWVAGTVVLCLLLSLAAWFLLIGPKRAEAAELEQQTVDTRSSNDQLKARIEQLKLQFAELPQRQAELAEIKQAMPGDPALPTLVRELDTMATSSGVTLMSLAPGPPATVAQPQATPTAAPAPAEGEDAAAEGESTGAAATPPAPAAPSTVLVSVPVNLVVVGDFFKAELFLKDLQADMKRAFLVQSLSVQAEKEGEAGGGKPATKNGDVTMTITGSVFVLKTADTAPATTPAPAATTTP
jgi:type IV pilus assembly protein PilO